MEVAQYDGSVVQGKADPQTVGCDQLQDRPQEHPLEQIVQRAEQQTPKSMPVAENDLLLSVEAPSCTNDHCDPLSLNAVATAQ